MKKILGFMLLFSLFGCSSKEGYQKITADDAVKKIDEGAYLIDVREPDEYADSHIVGSTNIPLGDIEQQIKNIIDEKQSSIIVYCRSGSRSKQASNALISMGYSNVYDLGGIQSWPYEIEK